MNVEINDVTVELGGNPIVHDVTVVVAPGEFLGVLGPNGSGKSTLLRTIYRFLAPDAGAVFIDGDDVTTLVSREAARRTAVLAQESSSDFNFSALDVVLLGRIPHLSTFQRIGRSDIDLAMDSLSRVSASHLADRSFPTLSGGERQHVLLARALTQQAPVVVLDEPTNHLDIRHQLELMDLIAEFGLTTIAALHDLNLAMRHCDRVCVLQAGEVVAAGAPRDALKPATIRDVFAVDAVVVADPVDGSPHLCLRRRPFTSIPNHKGEPDDHARSLEPQQS